MQFPLNSLTVILYLILFCSIFSLNLKAEPINIGFNLALSGTSAELGSDCIKGYEIAKSLSGDIVRDLNFVVEDNRSEPKTAVDVMRKLLETDKVSLVLTQRSPLGMALNPISKLKKIPLMGIVGHKDFVPQNEYAFQVFPTTEVEGVALANFLIERKVKTLSVLTTEDDWTKSLSGAVVDKFVASGGIVVFNETILPGESDVLSVLTKLKSKNADAVLLDHTLGEIGIVFRKARQLSIPGLLLSNYWIRYESVIKVAGKKEVENVYFSDMKFSYEKFLKTFEEKYHTIKVGAPSLCCYLATFGIYQASDKVRNGDASSMFNALNGMKQVELPDGIMKIDGRVFQIPIAMMKMVNGEATELPIN